MFLGSCYISFLYVQSQKLRQQGCILKQNLIKKSENLLYHKTESHILVPIWFGVDTFSQALRPPDAFVLQLRTFATKSNVAASIEEKYNSRKIVIVKKFRSYEVK